MPTTIKTTNLTRKFGSLTAVNNLTIDIAEGEIFGLVGPDGAGKTTTMRLLTGILDPTSGEGWVYDKNIIKEAESLKENIAYMSQRFGLYEELTVLENINFYADIYGIAKEKRSETIDRLLGFSGLLPFKHRPAGKLSGGMKQKLGLSCALVHTPRVLFLDEPTNGVDPVSRRDFWNILYDLLKEKVTIFCSTCYLDEAERCRRVGMMHEGKLLRCDSPDNIKKERGAKTLEEAFVAIIKEHESDKPR
ncbi:MAG: ABC transporter ATP-binding protein [Candidatus Omnitrophota bacterium]|nr:ABC transporter ATP-binding protein [Candidatus Omnitrophota bacterium]